MASSRATLAPSSFTDFGTLLRVLRHRARLTQRQLGIAVGYSEAQISRLEQGRRRPDPAVVAALFLPALRLGSEPELAARLHELAVSAHDGPVPGYRPERDAPPTVAPGGDAADLAAIPSPPSHYVERADGDNGIDHCIAIDDGVSQRAWALVVGGQTYADARAGTLVHVQVDPRRNQLIAIAPAGAPARW